MRMIEIQLSHVERQMAKAVAKKKTTDCAGYESTAKLKDGFDYIGTCGEIAFANYMGIDWDWRSHKQGDGGVDFRLKSGLSVDVKSTKGLISKRHLMVPVGKVVANIYVQTVHSPNIDGHITLVGFAWMEELLDVEPVRWPGFHYENHIMDHSDLHSMDEISN